MMKYFLLLSALISAFYVTGQNDFYKTYGGNGYDYCYDIEHTSDNGFVFVGSTSSFDLDNSDLYLVKLDSLGNIEWSRTFGTSGIESGAAVLETSDGGYITAGKSNLGGYGGYDGYVTRWDQAGTLIWNKRFGGYDWDYFNDVVEYDPGKFAFVGTSASLGDANGDGWVVYYDEGSETVIQEDTINYGGRDILSSVIVVPNQGIYIAGGITSDTSSIIQMDHFLQRINESTLQPDWTFIKGRQADSLVAGQDDYINDIVATDSLPQNIIAVGNSSDTGVTTVEVLNINGATGDFITNNYLTGERVDAAAVAMRADNNGAVLSMTRGGNKENFEILFMGNNGNAEHGDLESEIPTSISRINSSDGFVLAGYTNGYGASYSDVLIIRVDYAGLVSAAPETVNDSLAISLTDSALIALGLADSPNNTTRLTLYPNPASQEISIVGNGFSTFTLYTITGQQVLVQRAENSHTNINLGALPNGLYILAARLKSGDVKTSKVQILRE